MEGSMAPLALQFPDIKTPAETQLTMLQLANAQRAERNAASTEKSQNALQAALNDPHSFKVGDDGSVTVDKPVLMSTLMKTSPLQAYQLSQQFTTTGLQQDKERVDTQKANLENAIKVNEIIGGLVDSVNDQPSYDAAISRAAQLGLPGLEQVPKTYDPAYVKVLKTGYLDTKSRLDQMFKTMNLQLDIAKYLDHREEWRYKQDKETQNADADIENRIRNSYTDQTRTYQAVRSNYGAMQAALKPVSNPKAQGASDISLLYSFMKILDPTSVVREGEFATAKNSGSVPDRVTLMYNNALQGNLLTPNMRASIANEGQKLYDQHTGDYRKLKAQYRDIAVRNGVNPDNVVVDYESTATRTQPTGGKVITMGSVKLTAAKSGRTVQEVIKAAKAKGYTIQ